jgi:hypothetical protein
MLEEFRLDFSFSTAGRRTSRIGYEPESVNVALGIRNRRSYSIGRHDKREEKELKPIEMAYLL